MKIMNFNYLLLFCYIQLFFLLKLWTDNNQSERNVDGDQLEPLIVVLSLSCDSLVHSISSGSAVHRFEGSCRRL